MGLTMNGSVGDPTSTEHAQARFSLLRFVNAQCLSSLELNASFLLLLPSSFPLLLKLKYEVFLSFRGEETRQTLQAICVKPSTGKTLYFIDDKLNRGEEISSALLSAIERQRSRLSFSLKGTALQDGVSKNLKRLLNARKSMVRLYVAEMEECLTDTGNYLALYESQLVQDIVNKFEAIGEEYSKKSLNSLKLLTHSKIREESEKSGGLNDLRQRLSSRVLGDKHSNSGFTLERKRLGRVLIVLDDVTKLDKWKFNGRIWCSDSKVEYHNGKG
ncbi:uncharacterized protein LOC116131792 [Pistacia vera]|uniref:uncharacterized protein LOC116131792 n=1 Tax=Pistacia vera TaxID=55513 RepID=UPI00126337D7|nr:uncharacterized protein LOC116131792 [Pistacia vera]